MTIKPKREDSFNKGLTIKSWAKADRPREKLVSKGKQQLSNTELLAILLGSGNKNESALDLAKRVLNFFENDLNQLGKTDLQTLQQFKGIGEVKAIKIIATLELGRRRQLTTISSKPQINSSHDAFRTIAPLIIDLPHEEFWIILLNRANRVIGRAQISSGGVAGTVVDAKVIFRKAIQSLACSMILVHNHPSGNLNPSQADIGLTNKLVKAGQTLDVLVLDHLIIGAQGYYSFADEQLI